MTETIEDNIDYYLLIDSKIVDYVSTESEHVTSSKIFVAKERKYFSRYRLLKGGERKAKYPSKFDSKVNYLKNGEIYEVISMGVKYLYRHDVNRDFENPIYYNFVLNFVSLKSEDHNNIKNFHLNKRIKKLNKVK